MTNHAHLLATPGDQGCAGMMKELSQGYAHYFNRRYHRTGTLWEGRFRSCLVQSERYVLACYRYIELNPVRAGMVTRPGEYRWSSYCTNAEGKVKGFVEPHAVYESLGREAYRELCGIAVPDSDAEEIRKATRVGCVVGARRRGRGRQPKADRDK